MSESSYNISSISNLLTDPGLFEMYEHQKNIQNYCWKISIFLECVCLIRSNCIHTFEHCNYEYSVVSLLFELQSSKDGACSISSEKNNSIPIPSLSHPYPIPIPSIIAYHYPPSSVTAYHHPSLSLIAYHHPPSPITTYHHLSSSTTIGPFLIIGMMLRTCQKKFQVNWIRND